MLRDENLVGQDEVPEKDGPVKRTKKYLRRQDEILNAAAIIMNQKGVKGMTRADIAAHFGIVQTGIAYYFESKEAVAAACFLRAIEVYRKLISEAAAGATVEDRVSRFVRGHFDFFRRVACGEEHEIASFDDVRALGDAQVINAYEQMFRHARTLFDGPPTNTLDRSMLNSRVHWLIQQLIWASRWLSKYRPENYPRAADKFIDIMTRGLAATGRIWLPPKLEHYRPLDVDPNDPQETFLHAATQLINEQGYRGASIDAIAARLDLTKGSFYYHIDAKDDLVEICFKRTIEVLVEAQGAADQLSVDGYGRLAAALILLVDHQLFGAAPLLRAASASLPEPIKKKIFEEFDRNILHFGSMVSDGIVDGSLRPTDAQIAAQMIMGTINGVTELAQWIPKPLNKNASEYYVRPLFEGLMSNSLSGQT